jgi:hypothetical protein
MPPEGATALKVMWSLSLTLSGVRVAEGVPVERDVMVYVLVNKRGFRWWGRVTSEVCDGGFRAH